MAPSDLARAGGGGKFVFPGHPAAVYDRRLRITGKTVPGSIVQVWCNRLQTPPVRRRAGQRGTMVRVPRFAVNDLAAGLFLPTEGRRRSPESTGPTPAIAR